MKRSEVNALIDDAKTFLASHRFHLPPWAFWKPANWKGRRADCAEIVDNMLGWDITDFGSGDFARVGLLLFTIRNGNPQRDRKPYAEKAMIVREGQVTPTHFHWKKMEDIVVRGGGRLVIELHGSTVDEGLSELPIVVRVDGVTRGVEPGGKVVLSSGESICLEQGVYHRFYGEPGAGTVLVGEVSEVNDDTSDNRFLTPCGRFPTLVEDVAPNHLLVSDYAKYL